MSSDKLFAKLRENPKDLVAFQQLEELFFLEKRWLDLAEVYQLRCRVLEVENRTEASKLLFKLGEIYEKRLNLPNEAIICYEKALKMNPYSRNVHALIGLYKNKQDWIQAIPLIQNELKHEKDEYKQLQLYLELAEIYKNHLRKLPLASDNYKAVLKIEQYHRESIMALQEIYQEQQKWPQLQEMLQLQLSIEKDSFTRAGLYQRLAILAQEQFRDIPKAIEYYTKMIEINPADLNSLHCLENLYLIQKDYLNQVETMSLRAKQTPELELRTQLYFTICQLWEEALQNPANAARSLRKVLGYDKNNFPVIHQLERLYRKMEDWASVVEMLEKKLTFNPPPAERKNLFFQLAEFWENQLQKEENAIHYYRGIIEIEPNHFDVLHRLQALYHKRGALVELLQMLQIEIEQTSSPADRIELYYQVGELAYQKLGQKGTAVQAYLNILDVNPIDRQALGLLKNIYLETGDWEALLQAYHRELSLCETNSDKIETYFKLGKLLNDKLSRYEEAIQHYQHILVVEPNHLATLRELKEIYRTQKQFEPLLQMTQTELKLVETTEEKIRLLMDIGHIQWEHFKQIRAAISTFHQVLEISAFYLPAIQSLKKIHFQESQWEDFIAMAKKESSLLENADAQIQVHLAIAETFVQKLQRSADSIPHYEKIYELAPGHPQASLALKEIYAQLKQWPNLIQFLLKEAYVLTDPTSLYEQYKRIALLYREELQVPQESVPYWEKAYGIIPSREPLDFLIPLYQSAQQWELLVSTYQRKLDLTPTAEEKIPLLLEQGKTFQDALQNIEKATKVYQAVIDLEPHHLSTLNILEVLLTQQKRWEELLEVHYKQIQSLSESTQKIAYHRKRGILYEHQLNKPKETIQEHYSILALDSSNMESIEELLRLYRELSLWYELTETLERKYTILPEKEIRIALLFEMGELLHLKQKNGKRAVEKYEHILTLESQDPASPIVQKANQKLIEIHQWLRDWPKLIQSCHLLLKYTETSEEKIRICHQIADLNRIELLHLDASEQILLEALKLDEFHLPTIQKLTNLAKDKGDYLKQIEFIEAQINLADTDDLRRNLLFEVASIYQQQLKDLDQAIFTLNRVLEIQEKDFDTRNKLTHLYQMMQRYEEAIQSLSAQIPLLSEVLAIQKVKVEIAWIYENYLHQEEQSIQVLEEALALSPTPQLFILNPLLHLYRKRQEYANLERILQQYLKISDLSPEMKKHLLLEAGFISGHYLQQPDRAETYYLQILELDTKQVRAIKALEQIYEERKTYEPLVRMYERELKVSETSARSIFLHYQIASLSEMYLKQRQNALVSYQNVFSLDPKNLLTMRELEKIYQYSHEDEKLSTVYEKELSVTSDVPRKLHLHQQLGTLYEENLSQRKRAILNYLQAHTLQPKNLATLKKLVELYQKEQDWVKLIEILDKAIPLAEKVSDQLELLSLKGQTQLEEIQNEIVAEQTFLKLLQISPRNPIALTALKKIYEKKQPLKWVNVVEQEIADRPEEISILEPLLQIGKIYESANKIPEAIACFQRVNTIEPGNKTALNELLKIHQREEKWEPLIQIFELAATLTKNVEEEIKLYFKIGEIYASKQLDSEKAIRSFQKVLARQKHHLPSLQNIVHLYKNRESWAQVIDYLLLEIDASTEMVAKNALFLEVAEIFLLRLQNPNLAIDYYLKALRNQFGIGPALETAKKLLAEQHREKDLIELLEKEEQQTPDPLKKSFIKAQIGELYSKKLKQPREAIPFYQKAVEFNSMNISAWYMLATLYEQETFFSEAGMALEKIVSFEESQKSSEEIRGSLYWRLAELYRLKLGLYQQAIRYYEKVLALKPKDLLTIHLLQNLYHTLGQYKQRIDLNQKELQLVEALPRRIALLEDTGFLWDQRLFQTNSAITTYEKLQEIDPENASAIQALRTLYPKESLFSKLIALHYLEIRLAEKTDDLKTLVKLYHRISTIYVRDLKDTRAAIQTLETLLERDPANQNAIQVLQQLYLEEKDYTNLVAMYKKELDFTSSEERQKLCLWEIAKLEEEQLHHPEEAITYYNHVLLIDSKHLNALKALRRLYREEKQWVELSEVLEKEAEVTDDPLMKADLLLSLGELLREQFQDRERAIVQFWKTLEFNQGYLKAISSLREVYLEQKEWQKAVPVFEMEIKYIPDKQSKVELLTQLGQLLQQHLSETDKAQNNYEKALELNATHLPAILPLAQILYHQKQWELGSKLLAQSLQAPLDPSEKAKILYQLADAYQHLEKTDMALLHYRESYHLTPDYLPTLKALGALYVRLEKWSLAREIFEKLCPVLATESSSDLHEKALFQLAEIYTNLNENIQSIKTYQDLLRIAPKRTQAILNLATAQEKQGDFKEMIPLLKNLLSDGALTAEAEGKALWLLGKALLALGDYAETQQILKRCIQKNHSPVDCWTLIAQAQLQSGQFKEAIESLQQKIPLLIPSPALPQELDEKKSQIWGQIGDIYAEKMQAIEPAIQAYQNALSHTPHSLQTIEALGKFLETEKSWEALIQHFETFVAKLPAKEIQKSIGLHLKMGQVQLEQLQQPQKAVGHFKAVLQLDSHHYAAHLALAQIQSSNETGFEEAIQEHLYLLKKDPCLLDSYHSLGKIFKQQGKKSEYFSVCQALALFKDIQKDELAFYNSSRTAIILNPARILEPELREEYLLRDFKNSLLRKLLQLTNDSMEKAFPPNWEAYNVRKKDRLTPETSSLLYKIFSEIKSILKIGEVTVYLTEMKLPQPVLEVTTPPTLIVPQHLLTELSLEELYFTLGRQLFFIADNQLLLSKLSEEQMESYFQYLSPNDVPQENHRETQKRVKASVSRKIKKDVDELIAQYQAQASQISIRDYRKKLYRIANRVGVLLSNSLPHAVRFLAKMDQKTGFTNLSTPQVIEVVRSWPEIQDLLHFGLSPEILKLRQTLGWNF